MTKCLILLAAAMLFLACGEEEKTVADNDTAATDDSSCGAPRDVCNGRQIIRCISEGWVEWKDCGDDGCEETNGVVACITTDEIQTQGDDEDAVNDDDAVVAGYTLTDVLYTDLLEQTPGGLPFDEKRYEVFRDETAFGLFFTSLGLSVEEPVVDFEKDMVIALFNGMWPTIQPIYNVDSIKKLVPDDPEEIHHKVLFVYTTTHYYSDKLPADQMFYYPLRLIKVEKADLVNFNDRFVIETSY